MTRDEPSALDLADGWICSVRHGTRTVQPDRDTPSEPCPRCVDPDEAAA